MRVKNEVLYFVSDNVILYCSRIHRGYDMRKKPTKLIEEKIIKGRQGRPIKAWKDEHGVWNTTRDLADWYGISNKCMANRIHKNGPYDPNILQGPISRSSTLDGRTRSECQLYNSGGGSKEWKEMIK